MTRHAFFHQTLKVPCPCVGRMGGTPYVAAGRYMVPCPSVGRMGGTPYVAAGRHMVLCPGVRRMCGTPFNKLYFPPETRVGPTLHPHPHSQN